MAAEKKSKALALPDSVVTLLADADKQRGFPPGTMLSLMSQEIGGQESKYLEDPSAYHYGVDAAGRRGPKNSKVTSTAFGPFGIVKSTAAKPGYGLSPLKGMSFEDQLNFAADYLAARSKSAGGLEAGLAGYGEGTKYAAQVADRRDKGKAMPPVQLAMAQQTEQSAIKQSKPLSKSILQSVEGNIQNPEPTQTRIDNTLDPAQQENEWVAFTRAMREPVQENSLAYGAPTNTVSAVPQVNIPDFMKLVSGLNTNMSQGFSGFMGYGGRG